MKLKLKSRIIYPRLFIFFLLLRPIYVTISNIVTIRNNFREVREMFYGVFTERKFDGKEYVNSYGITYENNLIRDISDSLDEICELTQRLNNYEVEPTHIYDVIEDFLCEKYTVLSKPIELR